MKNTKPFYFSIIMLFIFKIAAAQVNTYYDENLVKTDSLYYVNKCYYEYNFCYKFTNKDTIINLIYNRYNFGKLSKKQLMKVEKALKTTIRKNLIIVYTDTVYPSPKEGDAYKSYVQRHKLHSFRKPMDESRFDEWMHTSAKKFRKCFAKLKKKNYIDGIRYYHNVSKRKFTSKVGYSDSKGILKAFFFRKNKNYRFVVLRPNGEFFQVNSSFERKKMKKLLKAKDWAKFKLDLKESKKSLLIKKGNFFKFSHIDNQTCF